MQSHYTYSPSMNHIIKVHGAHLNIASLGLDLFEATQCYAVNTNMYATVRECYLWAVRRLCLGAATNALQQHLLLKY